IVTLANVCATVCDTQFNPTGSVKFAVGLFLLGIGFGALAYGASEIPSGATTASVSMIWLILAYFFHTTGELCLSPVGLSYMSKLSPKNLIGLIMGFWFLSSAIANFMGGFIGSYIDQIAETYSI